MVFINHTRLTDIECLCRLVNKTSGEAREIVSKFPLTHRCFKPAWNALKSTYINLRLLVHSQLKSLFALPALDQESSAGFKSIQLGIASCLSTIFYVPTDNWDPIAVFTLPSRSAKLNIENSRIDTSFVVDPLNVDNFHSLAIYPCNIGVFDGSILTCPTFRDL